MNNSTLDQLRQQREKLSSYIQQIEMRLSGWLMAGNAAALLLCFNALLDRRICDWPRFQPLVQQFGLGVFAAFLAVLFTALLATWSVGFAIHKEDWRIKSAKSYIAKRRNAEEQQTPEGQAQLATTEKNMARERSWFSMLEFLLSLFALATLALFVTAATTLVGGINAVVSGPTFATVLCPAK